MTRFAALALLPTLVSGPVALAQTAPAPPRGPAAPASPAAPVAPAPAISAAPGLRAREVRSELHQLLRDLPPAIGTVLRHDPSLLTRADYLAPYPALGAFLAQHPEVALNPTFYLGAPDAEESDAEARGLRMASDVIEGIGVLAIISTFMAFFMWLVRIIVEHRRWLRQSKTQVEAHAKVLDRLSGEGELLAYIQSPAGRKFLESAPIEVDGRARPSGSALGRVLVAVQAGIVLVALGIGFWMLQSRFGQAGQGFTMLSTLALALGTGFLGSAAAAYVISLRHGLIGAEPRITHE